MPEKLIITTRFDVYKNLESLEEEDRLLLKFATDAVGRAYAPYSNFFVGAALLLENGEIITGNNQENAAYPSGMCAERVAIYYAGSRFPGMKIKSIAVTARTPGRELHEPVPPCGGCRQVLAEYESKNGGNIKVIMCGEKGDIHISESVSQLLPLSFTSKNL